MLLSIKINLLLIGYISSWLFLLDDEQDQEMLEMQVLGVASAEQGDSSGNQVCRYRIVRESKSMKM